MGELALKIASVDLISVIEGYGIELKRTGPRYKAVCPFHGDKDPSLVIYTGNGKSTWRCFGCGKHGDVADFVAEYERIDLKQALKRLGLSPEPVSPSQRKYIEKRKTVMAEFKKRVKDTVACLGLLMQTWEIFTRTPENAFDNPQGYDFYNQWWDWQERLILGSDEERYDITRAVTVKVLTGQAKSAGIL